MPGTHLVQRMFDKGYVGTVCSRLSDVPFKLVVGRVCQTDSYQNDPKNGSSSHMKTENSSISAGFRSISMTAEQFLLGDSFKFHNVF